MHGKHNFKFVAVEDLFLYKQLRFQCEDCFMECIVERSDFYNALTTLPVEVDWDDLWQ